MHKKIKILIRLSALLLFSLGLFSCAGPFQFINYSLSNTPRYSQTVNPPYRNIYRDRIKVVSYNIKHSARIKQAVELLRDHNDLANADILLLQEMIPSAVEKIAKELDYNYVFYPAVIHPILHDNFGNAILSKWPITYDENFIFPSLGEKGRHRIAVAAKLNINGQDVLVYSLHMGVFMKPVERGRQIQEILDAMEKDIKYCVIGGDFNTLKEKDVNGVSKTFLEAGFDHATSNVDWTYNHWYFMNYKSVFDHIFTLGLKTLRSGKVDNRKPSDHLPVWAEFTLE